ncbi:hypothetical protein [Xanthobacter dioxanivorans]|nr:hypothetical protein [Xanthobacter dioxanivorans]
MANLPVLPFRDNRHRVVFNPAVANVLGFGLVKGVNAVIAARSDG